MLVFDTRCEIAKSLLLLLVVSGVLVRLERGVRVGTVVWLGVGGVGSGVLGSGGEGTGGVGSDWLAIAAIAVLAAMASDLE